MRRADERRSSWFPLTAGCALFSVVLVISVVVVGVFGIRVMRQVRSEIRNPDDRTQTAVELLGGAIPPGYEAQQNLSLWPLAEVVYLTSGDRDVDRYFVYLKMRADSGRDAPIELLERQGFERLPGIFVGRGELSAGLASVQYRQRRGPFVTDDGFRLDPAWISEMQIDCPEEEDAEAVRFALWAVSAQVPEAKVGEPPRAPEAGGTPGDPEAMQTLLAGFDLCAR